MESLVTLASAAADMTMVHGAENSDPNRNSGHNRKPALLHSLSDRHIIAPQLGDYMEFECRQDTGRERDWRVWLSIEERMEIRQKIVAAYKESGLKDFEQLLAVTSAIEEEFLHLSAPSRLDYFKSGVQYDKRVAEKIDQLRIPSQHLKTGINGASSNKKQKNAHDVKLEST